MKPITNPAILATPENLNLLRAAEIIEKGGWCRGNLESGPRHCVAGALNMAAYGNANWKDKGFLQYVHPLGLDKLHSFLGEWPIYWNNRLCRSAEDCAQTLRDCAAWEPTP